MARQIAFKMPKHWLVFSESEMDQLLRSQPDLWEMAIIRGKSFGRIEKEQSRRAEQYAIGRGQNDGAAT